MRAKEITRQARRWLVQGLACAVSTVWIGLCGPAAQAATSGEIDALTDLYSSTSGAGWEINNNWLQGDPCNDNWYGISCNYSGGVTEINLFDNNLIGTLPSSLSKLTNLTTFDVFGNRLSGGFPSALTGLDQLNFIDLAENQFSGLLPGSIGNLSNLTWLDLYSNQFSGTIPDDLRRLSKLEFLDLSDNRFTGAFPSSVTVLDRLRGLGLENLNLTGTIPTSVANLKELVVFAANANGFSGGFPDLA